MKKLHEMDQLRSYHIAGEIVTLRRKTKLVLKKTGAVVKPFEIEIDTGNPEFKTILHPTKGYRVTKRDA